MGSFILESIRMKVLIAGLLCATVALALPEGRRLRAEEYWRPAQGRDLSKYKPRQAMVPATAENLAWAVKEVKKTGASTKKGTNVDLKATCGIEGPARAGRIVGGHEAEEHEWPWQVALFIDDAWFCGGSLINENYVLLLLTVLRSPPTMAGLTHSGMTTPLPMILPSLNCHHQLTSTTTSLHPACLWVETLLTRENS